MRKIIQFSRKCLTKISTLKNINGIRYQRLSKTNYVCTLADSGFFKNFMYQGGVKSTVFWVFEDLKFKISEGYD